MIDQTEIDRRLALIKVGAWYSECCALDLYEIATEADAQTMRDRIRDEVESGDYIVPMIWATEREGLLYFREFDVNDRPLIDARLARCAIRK